MQKKNRFKVEFELETVQTPGEVREWLFNTLQWSVSSPTHHLGVGELHGTIRVDDVDTSSTRRTF